ncbi:MAG: alpha-glucosidase [Candidatus Epulonipiscium fishelsonii]|nr:MAG: alpha-glucosidase [Epulopiscium sp. AS2M-Bin002]
MKICKKVLGVQRQGSNYIVHTNCADIKIYFLTDEIIRVRASFDKEFAEESYVLSLTAWEDRLDELFRDERTCIEPTIPEYEENDTQVIFSTKKARLVIYKNPINIILYDNDQNILYSDIAGNPYTLDANNRINHYTKINIEDCFYGFGEKGGSLNKAQKYMRLSAKDAMGYDPVDIDSLYKHIPFYIKLNANSGKAVGLFYHNFYECAFNMGCEKSNYWPYYSSWQADGGDIDLFLIVGPEIKNIINNYTRLTGRPVLIPKRGLGYQGSSMFYPELEKDCDDAVLEFIDTIKEEGFPIDGFHLSSGYTSYEAKRCVFTWNTTRFKDPKEFFHVMNEKGAQCVPNVKPGILTMHPWFDEFTKKDVWVKDSENPEEYAIGKWWGGEGAFWDFTKPQARKSWKEYLTENIIKTGTNSIWNDNCEYDSLMDLDAVCDFDGKKGTIGQLKPIMSTLMCKMAVEAVKENDPDIRPYVVCRSGSAGIQKYAQTWCGDNFTSWKSLKYNIPTILGMGLSGCPEEGSDIGGFSGRAPEEELFVRWVQQGIFQPRFSIHSTNIDNTVTEPWMYHNSTKYIRDAILFRYRMLPYLYSALYEAHKTGSPIMRALVYEFQDDKHCWNESFEYMFGKNILLANVIEKGAKNWKVYLPKGCKWYSFDKFECYEGGQEIEIPVAIDTIPMFIRDGAIIPMAGNQIMNMEKDKITKLHLIVAPKDVQTYLFYNDDGFTNNFEKGVFCKTNINVAAGERTQISIKHEGEYEDTINDIMIEIIAKEKSPYWINLNDKKITHFLNRKKFEQATEGWYYSQTKKSVLIKFENPKDDYDLIISFEIFDMIGM